MLKHSLILLFSLIINSARTQQLPSTCTSYKNGIFKVSTKYSGVIIVKRSGGLQVEENLTSKLKLIYALTWLDDCTYELKLKKVVNGKSIYQTTLDSIVRCQIDFLNPKYLNVRCNSTFRKKISYIKMEILDRADPLNITDDKTIL